MSSGERDRREPALLAVPFPFPPPLPHLPTCVPKSSIAKTTLVSIAANRGGEKNVTLKRENGYDLYTDADSRFRDEIRVSRWTLRRLEDDLARW